MGFATAERVCALSVKRASSMPSQAVASGPVIGRRTTSEEERRRRKRHWEAAERKSASKPCSLGTN
eukprot:318110-Pleurochrysis_carterae.AAC.2